MKINFYLRLVFSILFFNLLYNFIDPVNTEDLFTKDFYVYQKIAGIEFTNFQEGFWQYASETTGAYPGYYLLQYFLKIFVPYEGNSIYFISLFIYLTTSLGLFFPYRINNISFIAISFSLYPIILSFSALKLGASIAFYIIYQKLKFINKLSSRLFLFLSIITHPQILILAITRYIYEKRFKILKKISNIIKSFYFPKKKHLLNILIISFFLISSFFLIDIEIIKFFPTILIEKIYNYTTQTFNFTTFIKGISAFIFFFFVIFNLSKSISTAFLFSLSLLVIIASLGTHRILIMIWYLFLIPFNKLINPPKNKSLLKTIQFILLLWGMYRTFYTLVLI